MLVTVLVTLASILVLMLIPPILVLIVVIVLMVADAMPTLTIVNGGQVILRANIMPQNTSERA